VREGKWEHRSVEPAARQTLLSIVVPVYGSPASLRPLAERVALAAYEAGVAYELLLVDDRCPHGSWPIVRTLALENRCIRAIRLARNFGQHAAIQAGLSEARGDWVVVMDCDLQDRPEEIPNLLRAAVEGGCEIVQATRGSRSSDRWHRKALSKLFYRVLGYLTGADQSAEIANFGIYHRRVIDTIISWDEDTKYFPAIISWVGFNRTTVPVAHDSRLEGKSSYNLLKLLTLGMNVVIGFSDRPLRLVMGVGLVLAMFSFLITLLLVTMHLSGSVVVTGWASLIVSIWFLGGMTIFSLGLVGLYVGRILNEAKGRPSFVVDEIVSDTRSSTTDRTAWSSRSVDRIRL
jgi:dolichol-phosphate mannosyltransferase